MLVVAGILIALQINNWNENQREKKVELVYMKSLLEDLEADKVIYSELEANNILIYAIIDSLVHALKSPDLEEHVDQSSYWARMITIQFQRPQPVERTFEQMKSSGQLKLVSDQSVADGISLYYNSLSELKQYNDAAILWLADYLKSVGKVFDGETLLKILKERKKQPPGSSELMTTDPRIINELISSVQYIYGVVKISENICIRRKNEADELIGLISDVYSLH